MRSSDRGQAIPPLFCTVSSMVSLLLLRALVRFCRNDKDRSPTSDQLTCANESTIEGRVRAKTDVQENRGVRGGVVNSGTVDALLGLLALIGLVFFTMLRSAQDAFYNTFGTSAAEVGIGYAATLSQSVVLLARVAPPILLTSVSLAPIAFGFWWLVAHLIPSGSSGYFYLPVVGDSQSATIQPSIAAQQWGASVSALPRLFVALALLGAALISALSLWSIESYDSGDDALIAIIAVVLPLVVTGAAFFAQSRSAALMSAVFPRLILAVFLALLLLAISTIGPRGRLWGQREAFHVLEQLIPNELCPPNDFTLLLLPQPPSLITIEKGDWRSNDQRDDSLLLLETTEGYYLLWDRSRGGVVRLPVDGSVIASEPYAECDDAHVPDAPATRTPS